MAFYMSYLQTRYIRGAYMYVKQLLPILLENSGGTAQWDAGGKSTTPIHSSRSK